MENRWYSHTPILEETHEYIASGDVLCVGGEVTVCRYIPAAGGSQEWQ